MECDDPNKILRLITIDAVNRLKIFLSFQAPPGFTIPLRGGKTLCVGPNAELYIKSHDGKVDGIPLDLAVAVVLGTMALNVARNEYVQGVLEGDGDQDG